MELADTSGLSPDGLSVRVQVSLPSPICQRVGIGRRGGLKNRCFMRVSSSLTVDTNMDSGGKGRRYYQIERTIGSIPTVINHGEISDITRLD